MSVFVRDFGRKYQKSSLSKLKQMRIYWNHTGIAYRILKRREESGAPYGFFLPLQVALILFSCRRILPERKGTWPLTVS